MYSEGHDASNGVLGIELMSSYIMFEITYLARLSVWHQHQINKKRRFLRVEYVLKKKLVEFHVVLPRV